MKQGRKVSLILLVAFGILVWLCRPVANAAWMRQPVSIRLNCDHPGEIIGEYLDRLRPGDTLLVTGTCRENVLIPPQFLNVTLNGQGTATIDGPDGTNPTVQIEGSGITIQGFKITGGLEGVSVTQGGNATITGNMIYGTGDNGIGVYKHSFAKIDGNTIHHAGNYGINVKETSAARIINNTVENAPGNAGIGIAEGSSARIGISSPDDTAPSPNTVRNNNGHGVRLQGHSSAVIAGNMISNNSKNGVYIQENSEANVAGNTIQGNAGNGIRLIGSGLTLGASPEIGLTNLSNSTDPSELNQGYGIECDFGGYLLGQQGTAQNSLNGASGRRALDPTCINRLSD